MKAEKIQLTSDTEEGKRLLVTGRSAECILDQRIVMGATSCSEKHTDVFLNDLITQNIVLPTAKRRVIPELTIGTEKVKEVEKTITTQYDGESLLECAAALSNHGNFGFRFLFDGAMFSFQMYAGKDRTRFQTENNPVIFSPDYENLLSTEFLYDKTPFANCIQMLADQHPDSYSSKSKIHYTVVADLETSGLDLYEKTVQAENLSPDDTSYNDYIQILSSRAHDNLYKAKIKKEFSGETLTTSMYQYGEDYELGDTVSVVDELGIEGTAVVSEITEVEDAEGYRLVPTLADWKAV